MTPAAAPVQLSILFPTHRHDLKTVARIAQACAWAGPSMEVIVRDNSGDPAKRAQIAQFRREHCTILSVDPCPPLENFTGLMQRATGEFVFCLADDDLFFDAAMAALPAVLARIDGDQAIAGISGDYLVETSKGVGIVSYDKIDSDDVTARVASFATNPAVNVLFYSIQRRAMVERVMRFMRAMPFYLSYHDQILCLLYLLHGKFVKLPRLFYGYDLGVWEDRQSAQEKDLAFYSAAGLDPAVNMLHWFLCALEGAILIRNGDIFPDHPLAARQKMADQWFSSMFARFSVQARTGFDSPFAPQAEALCQKLRASQGRLSFVDMLSDVCHFLALFSDAKAQAYLRFWAAALKPRQPAALTA